MIRVKRVTGPADLKTILNLISADDPQPIILIDTPGNNTDPPVYTVIWKEGDVVIS